MGTRARVTTVAGAATLLCAAGVSSVFGTGSAIAATVSTSAASMSTAPVVAQPLVGACGDTVHGTPGQPVGVRLAGLSVIDLGQVPSSGVTTFDASSIVRGLLGPLAPVCQVTAEAIALPTVLAPVEAVAAPVVGVVQGVAGSLPVVPQQPVPVAPAAPAPAPIAAPQAVAPAAPVAAPVHGPTLPQFSPYALGRFHSGMPLYNYAELLVGRPGGFGRLPTSALTAELLRASAGSLPSGSLITGSLPGGALTAGAQNPAAEDIAAAGQASALPAATSERVALPVLVAVLMVAAVTAAVIRSWVIVKRR